MNCRLHLHFALLDYGRTALFDQTSGSCELRGARSERLENDFPDSEKEEGDKPKDRMETTTICAFAYGRIRARKKKERNLSYGVTPSRNEFMAFTAIKLTGCT